MVKNLPAMWKTQVRSLVLKIPWRSEWQPTPVFLSGESRGERSLVGYSPWGCKEWDTTEQLHFLLFFLSLGLEWKLAFSSPVATAEFSKFAGILSEALSQHQLFRIWNSSAEIPSPPLALFAVNMGVHISFQVGFRKGRGTRDQIANIHWVIEKAREFQKNIYFCSLTMPKPWIVWITINWKILKEMGIPEYLTCLLRNLYAGQEATVRTRHGTTDWFQNRKRSTSRLYIVTLLI